MFRLTFIRPASWQTLRVLVDFMNPTQVNWNAELLADFLTASNAMHQTATASEHFADDAAANSLLLEDPDLLMHAYSLPQALTG